ncbi:hypothetical protein [Streptomyces orinoci]|uniref:Uncharacterized protein n=1 Tax=Streptomyces orinoci TaxID=67339 RepID=A0ABV3K4Y8_STRON|nr:hypothetical protein [Streptomyces orinoci]
MAAAFCSFVVIGGPVATKVGWSLYICGWVPALAMLGWCGIKRSKPGVGGVFAFSLLAVSGVLFWLNHG